MPNNILYFIDSRHAPGDTAVAPAGAERAGPSTSTPDIHARIALITLGCLAMVVSIVLSFFAATSKRKMDDRGEEPSKSTRTVFACLIVMNAELFMSAVAGCMELLYRPLIQDEHRLHNMECAIAVFNIAIYAMYVVTMVLTPTVLKEKQDEVRAGSRKDATEIAIAPNSSRQPLLLQQQGQWESLLFAIQRNRYRADAEGSDATGYPPERAGGSAKKVRMEIARPYPAWSARCKHLSRSTVIPVVVRPAHGDPVRGLRWGLFDGVLADEPASRGGRAVRTTSAGEEAGRLFERDNVNTTLVENALGDPLSKTLVLDPAGI
ncbi:hypothetical protein Q5P01_000539 [Channa striata]|uniref:Uncharacterized protein n=1 Tax=Channa striata TaxID=64152 RepID=A0AA88IHM1_CHASR|nr:hypothetical protein Q5P01_000539 [Channa striata]